MNMQRAAGRAAAVLAAPLMLAGVVAGLGPAAASAATCQAWTGGQQPPSPGNGNNDLSSVTVVSACNAWAVRTDINGRQAQTLIEHWNGGSWTVVPSPSPGIDAELSSVAATSATNAWAVGQFTPAGGNQTTLILHWDGSTWQQVDSSIPASTFSSLGTLAATSTTNAWAAGFTDGLQPLILHWNGTSWKQVTSPTPDGSDQLRSASATSASNAWSVGFTGTSTLILVWNGQKWAKVPSPAGDQLNSVAATSASNAWAVGDALISGVRQPLAIHCC